MKIYHYTKGLHLKSIFNDGFIATEQKRNLNPEIPFYTDLVWLTESSTVPVTALPFIPSIPSTNLELRGRIKNMATDYSAISKLIGGFWRFGFDSKHPKCEKWFFSKARNEAYKDPGMLHMDQIANRVGDNIRNFWVSEEDIPLDIFTLEILDTASNEWVHADPSSIRFVPTSDREGYAIHAGLFQDAA
jgi:hypothetical protein